MESKELKFEKIEQLEADTWVYQTDDGLNFYHFCPFGTPGTSERLYVIWQEREIDAVLPSEEMYCAGVKGNTLYFEVGGKIYTAVFAPSQGIRVSYIRDEREDEWSCYGDLYTRVRGNTNYAYRISDDPDNAGIPIDLTNEDLNGLTLVQIHRDMAIFTHDNGICAPTVRKLGQNAIVIEKSDSITMEAFASPDSCRFLYFVFDNELYTLHTETMRFLPPLYIDCDLFIRFIISVRRGVITLHTMEHSEWSLGTARLPAGYFSSVQRPRTEIKKACHIEKEPVDTSITIDGVDGLSDQCCCSVCHEYFDSLKYIPRVLDCGHTFCEICICNKQICINNGIKCPNCSIVSPSYEGKVLPKNFALISMAEQLMNSRAAEKVICAECEMKFSTSSVRMCDKEDCDMFNQLLCLTCALDGGHGGHAVKYDFKMAKIRKELREEVTDICAQVEESKKDVMNKSKKLVEISNALDSKLSQTNIPLQVIDQVDSLFSEREAEEYQEIVKDLAKTIMDECRIVGEAFDHAINTANGLDLFGGKEAD